jgi:hypothetical protein
MQIFFCDLSRSFAAAFHNFSLSSVRHSRAATAEAFLPAHFSRLVQFRTASRKGFFPGTKPLQTRAETRVKHIYVKYVFLTGTIKSKEMRPRISRMARIRNDGAFIREIRAIRGKNLSENVSPRPLRLCASFRDFFGRL